MIDTKIRISNGRYVDLANFKIEDIDLDSVTKSLNNIRRFTGHFRKKEPLTVAQHVGLTMKIADTLYPKDAATYLMCLIHDMPESIYGDFSSPLKRFLGTNLDILTNIDNTFLNRLWFLPKENLYQAQINCKVCDHISLRAEQLAMWGDYDCDDNPLELHVKTVLKEHPVSEWLEYVSDRYIYLQNTWLVMHNKDKVGTLVAKEEAA